MVSARRTSFQLGELWRAARPFTCRCGHARSHHASGRGRCARCATCPRPERATRWSLLTIGYRLGWEARGLLDPGAPLAVDDVLRAGPVDPPTVRLERSAPAELDDDPYVMSPDGYDGWSFTWHAGGFTIKGPDEEDR